MKTGLPKLAGDFNFLIWLRLYRLKSSLIGTFLIPRVRMLSLPGRLLELTLVTWRLLELTLLPGRELELTLSFQRLFFWKWLVLPLLVGELLD